MPLLIPTSNIENHVESRFISQLTTAVWKVREIVGVYLGPYYCCALGQ